MTGAAQAEEKLRYEAPLPQLDKAVRVMASMQLGKTMDDKLVQSIVAFLESLTSEVPSNFAPPGKRPEL
jgi:cytochrome c peroxidase